MIHLWTLGLVFRLLQKGSTWRGLGGIATSRSVGVRRYESFLSSSLSGHAGLTFQVTAFWLRHPCDSNIIENTIFPHHKKTSGVME